MQQSNGIQLPRLHYTAASFDNSVCFRTLNRAIRYASVFPRVRFLEYPTRDSSSDRGYNRHQGRAVRACGVSSAWHKRRIFTLYRTTAARNNSRLTDSIGKSHIHTRAPIYRRRSRDRGIIQITRKIRKATQRRLPENFDADLAAGSSLGRRCEHRATGTPTKALKRSTTTTAVTETTADVDRSRRRGGGFGAPRQILSSH